MEVTDLFLSPVYLLVFYLAASAIRPKVTNVYTRPYFFPALTLKFVGAIALGLVYQFYYGGGDTLNYHQHAQQIQGAFSHSFSAGWKIMTLPGGTYDPEIAPYTANMQWYLPNSAELLLVRIAAFFGLFCFFNYSVIALFFALLSFSGLWALYITFIKIRPQLYKQLAIPIFFIPSLFFWGSGLMKDSVCVGALGWLFYVFYKGAIQKRNLLSCLLIGGLVAYTLSLIKVYILLCFLPAALLWIFNENGERIKNQVIKVVAKPILLLMGLGIAFFAATNLTKGDADYDVDKIGKRTKVTSDYIYEVSVKQNGSAYKLGEQDGSLGGMVKLAPQAVIVALFRPFLWEVRNPIMLLSSLESLWFLLFTLRILYRSGVLNTIRLVARTPSLTLCFLFAIAFAGTVGIVSNNFGTLVRYKIPMIPFYVAGLYITESLSVKGKQKTTASTRRAVPA